MRENPQIFREPSYHVRHCETVRTLSWQSSPNVREPSKGRSSSLPLRGRWHGAAVTDEGKPANFPRTFVSRTSLRDSAHTVVAIRFLLGFPLWGSCHEVTERVKVACPTPLRGGSRVRRPHRLAPCGAGLSHGLKTVHRTVFAAVKLPPPFRVPQLHHRMTFLRSHP